ncbi:MAG: DUF721 domain-containing protein [Lentimicrobiaceae bacterium]|jgi:predicted nucleic acid-binding Zn ribbon protein|nr:DUF721 domain-containing protein [Lentimicrobiaceae bacterium]
MYSDEKPLREAIEDFLKAFKLNDKINQSRIIASWENVVGKLIAKHTTDIKIKNKTLYIKLDSPAIREELSYAKSKLIKNLNKKAGIEIISDIIFR